MGSLQACIAESIHTYDFYSLLLLLQLEFPEHTINLELNPSLDFPCSDFAAINFVGSKIYLQLARVGFADQHSLTKIIAKPNLHQGLIHWVYSNLFSLWFNYFRAEQYSIFKALYADQNNQPTLEYLNNQARLQQYIYNSLELNNLEFYYSDQWLDIRYQPKLGQQHACELAVTTVLGSKVLVKNAVLNIRLYSNQYTSPKQLLSLQLFCKRLCQTVESQIKCKFKLRISEFPATINKLAKQGFLLGRNAILGKPKQSYELDLTC